MKNLMVLIGLLMVPHWTMAKGPGEAGGGGEAIAAHYSNVSKKALQALKIVCKGSENPDLKASCGYLAPLELSIVTMKVRPWKRDTVLGTDGNPRDAGNDSRQTVNLDVDRWADKLKEAGPSAASARIAQVRLALHEPLVLAGAETNDSYDLSNSLVEFLLRNNFDLSRIVGVLPGPSVAAPAVSGYRFYDGSGTVNGNNWADAYSGAEAQAFRKGNYEGFNDCQKVRSWSEVSPLFKTRFAYVQVKCTKYFH